MKTRFIAMVALVAALGTAQRALAEQGNTNAPPRTYSGYVFDQFQWVDAPDLPQGARMALLENSPAKVGPYTVRYKLPAGYRIPLSWLSTDERITVLSGILNVGYSPSYDKNNAKAIGAGSFVFIPANMRFAAWTDTETVIQVHGLGPTELKAVYPR